MSKIVICVENLWKEYRLGLISHRLLYRDLQSWWARLRGKEDPNIKLNENIPGQKIGDRFWALRDISLEISEGEIVGMIGRNGAGKTTLLKILSRVTAPTRGQIKVKGRIASLLEVGTGFHPELTGRENVYLNGAILGMRRTEINRKFDEIAAFAEIEHFLDTPVKRYSSGMYVRLAFAVAAHLEPEILLVDEVLAVGDAEFQKKCLGKMNSIADEGRTVLFVSHNMSAINRLCSRAILLDQGKNVKDGITTEVTAAYLMGEADEGGGKIWTFDSAPGTADLRLHSVTLLNSKGTPSSVVEIQEQLELKIKYYVRKSNLRFRCAVMFFTKGLLAFASIEPTERLRSSLGHYCSTVFIPPHLLAEGEYIVGISIFTSKGSKEHYVKIKDVMSFHVYDSMSELSARGDYAQNLGGVLRPLLQWEQTFLG